ncbi:unnamed protein product [Cladocopium goreaui]|uniref:Cilia- and flagella-associated protein 206 n=1 Tax=Cladocopium goreaui TaxID=2562237 RepID=A0A9P1DLF6_9DINO|nr:unnamed protein product [Cladocopium goreaui]
MNSNKSNAHRRDLGWISGDPLGVAEITDLTIKADAEWVKKRMDEVWLGYYSMRQKLSTVTEEGSSFPAAAGGLEEPEAASCNIWEVPLVEEDVHFTSDWRSQLGTKIRDHRSAKIWSCRGHEIHVFQRQEPEPEDFPLKVCFSEESQAQKKLKLDESASQASQEAKNRLAQKLQPYRPPRWQMDCKSIVETLFNEEMAEKELKVLYERQASYRPPWRSGIPERGSEVCPEKTPRIGLKERASKLTSPAAIVEAMEQVITDFQVPPEREDRVLDQTRIRLKRIVAEAERDGAEETIRKMLAESSSTPSIDAVAARFKRDFGPVASVVEEELKVARIRRVQFLEMELETRWSRPFAGPLPPHSRAARRYELELGKKNPKVIAFVTEEARHAATLEADFEVELSDLRAKVRDLTQKRMEARARSLIQDFDEKLADAAAQVQEVIDRAILNIGPENPKVIKRAKELLSPDAHSTLFALQAEHTADQLRAELAVADPSPEAGDRRRGCAMALAALLGQLNRDHPLQAKLRAEFAQDLSEIAGTGAAREARDETAPPLPPPDEGPGEVTPPPVTDTEKPGAGESEGPTGPTDLELAIQMDEDPFKLEPTPEETNQALFEAGVRQYDDDPNLDLPDEEQDLWGAPKGFSELTSINHEVLDSTRKALEPESRYSSAKTRSET